MSQTYSRGADRSWNGLVFDYPAQIGRRALQSARMFQLSISRARSRLLMFSNRSASSEYFDGRRKSASWPGHYPPCAIIERHGIPQRSPRGYKTIKSMKMGLMTYHQTILVRL